MINPIPLSEHINRQVFQKFIESVNWEEVKNGFLEDLKKDIDKYIEDKNPDLLCSYNDIYKHLTVMIKDFEARIKTVDRKLKKLVDSTSLYEDVYKMRDEMKEIKKAVDKFNQNIKKVFT